MISFPLIKPNTYIKEIEKMNNELKTMIKNNKYPNKHFSKEQQSLMRAVDLIDFTS